MARQRKKAKPVLGPTSSEDAVRARAYENYQQRMRTGAVGDAVTDWINAEREIEATEPMGDEVRH